MMDLKHHTERLYSSLNLGKFQRKLLGVTIDKNFTFTKHVSTICKKAGRKVTALSRLVKIMNFLKRKILLKTFIESHFSYCPLTWMFHNRKLNRKINHIHERALRLVYDDYTSFFKDLLQKDGSVSVHHLDIHYIAIEMYKIKNKLSPKIVQTIFQQREVSNLRSEQTFLRPNINTIYNGEQS